MKLSYQYVSPETLIDRELSWLSFNTRVLELAEDSAIPLLERLRFLATVSSNLDDFFMIRVASINLKIESGIAGANSALEVLEALGLEHEYVPGRDKGWMPRWCYARLTVGEPNSKTGALRLAKSGLIPALFPQL